MDAQKTEDAIAGWATLWAKVKPVDVADLLGEAERRGERHLAVAGLIRWSAR